MNEIDNTNRVCKGELLWHNFDEIFKKLINVQHEWCAHPVISVSV